MADWYVNAASVGNGTHPASGFASVMSIGGVAAGDRVWVRRTHAASITNIPPVWSTPSHNRHLFVIGWPSDGDPFFEQRPAAGTSAGWDSDHAATATYSVYGLDWPTLTFSCNPGFVNSYMQVPDGLRMHNFCFNMNAQAFAVKNNFHGALFDNILKLTNMGVNAGSFNSTREQFFGKVWLPTSTANAAITMGTNWVEHVVIPDGGVIGAIIGPYVTNQNLRIGLVENECQSVGVFFQRPGAASGVMFDGVQVDRAVGVAPVNGITSGGPSNISFNSWWAINDYFGRGPAWGAAYNQPIHFMATSAQAMHNDTRVMVSDVRSIAATLQAYGQSNAGRPLWRSLVSVTSGTQVVMRVPYYVGSTAAFSAGNAFQGRLLARGCGVKPADQASTFAGSYDNWSGTYIAGGSAWLTDFAWTPEETGDVIFEVCAPPVFQATSGNGKTGYFLTAEPYSI